MSRYADGWEFNGHSEMYLRETFDLFAADTTDKTGVYKSGMRAIIEECHARALVMVAARNKQPMRFKRMMSFLGAINTGFAPISTTFRNQAAHHWLGKSPTDRQYIESIELGLRVTQSFDPCRIPGKRASHGL